MPISEVLKIISDENRLRILNILKEASLCVGEIQTILNISQSNASKHLSKLKDTGFITFQKEAQWIYYELNKKQLIEFPFIKQLLFKDINKDFDFQKDIERLKKYKKSGLCCKDLRDVRFEFGRVLED